MLGSVGVAVSKILFAALLDRHEWRIERRHCPHFRRVGIYGDAINHCGGWRLRCIDCFRYLDGPVSWATHTYWSDGVYLPKDVEMRGL